MKSGARRRIQMIIAGIAGAAFMMEQLDSTIVTTAAPAMAQSLGSSALRVNLAITSYLLTLVTFMPASGWLADRFGAKRVFCAALGLFTLGSALCGLSQSLPMLLAMRMLQGIGGGLMTPIGRSLLLRAFPRSELVRAMTWFNVPVVIGPTIGPVIGGVLSTYASWPWIFYINVPVGLIGIAASLRFVPDLKRRETPAFDLRGFLLIGAALLGLQAAVQILGLQQVRLSLFLACLTASATFLAFYLHHTRGARYPILDLSLLRIRTFCIGALVGGLSRVGINGLPYLLPLLLQLGFGRSAVVSGFLVSITCMGILLVRPLAGPLLRRFGFGRLLLGNTLLSAAAIAAFAGLDATSSDLLIFLLILGFSLARGLQFTTLNTLSYADIPRERLGSSTSLGGLLQQITMGFGVSVTAALLQALSGPGEGIAPLAFRVTLITLAALSVLAAVGFLALAPRDGHRAIPMRLRDAAG